MSPQIQSFSPKDTSSQLKILLLENIHSSAQELLRDRGYKIDTLNKSPTHSELLEMLPRYDVLGIRSKTELTAKLLEANPHLLCIGCFCIGTNQVDLNTARRLGISVFNSPFSNTRSVAELVLAEIVMLARELGDRNTEMHQGVWNKKSHGCFEVRGKTLGIVGYGHIGSQVGILGESFGMKIVYYDILPKLPLGNSRACRSLEELLTQSDFVTLHVPETDMTKNMISHREFSTMKAGSYLVNASRGSVVHLDDLHTQLKSGHIRGAALDVYPQEPQGNKDAFDSPLSQTPNVILTPHIGGSTEEAQANIGIEVAEAFVRYLEQGSSRGSVNLPEVDLPESRGLTRIVNIHKNVPGVISQMARIASDLGINISSQFLKTDEEMGYLIMDLDTPVDTQALIRALDQLPFSLRTRILKKA